MARIKAFFAWDYKPKERFLNMDKYSRVDISTENLRNLVEKVIGLAKIRVIMDICILKLCGKYLSETKKGISDNLLL